MSESIQLTPDRQHLFQFRFFCRPTPKHPQFFKLESVEFIVWIYDENHELAALRATTFVSLFPFTYEEKIIGSEITSDMLAGGQLEPWREEQCRKAGLFGIQFGFFKLDGNKEFHQWPE